MSEQVATIQQKVIDLLPDYNDMMDCVEGIKEHKYVLWSIAARLAWVLGKKAYKYVKNRNLVLEIDFKNFQLRETGIDMLGEIMAPEVVAFQDLIDAIYYAAGDSRVKGILMNVGDAVPLGLAQLQEFREALLNFKISGKRIIAYAETIGDNQAGIIQYYIASIADKIYLAECGNFNVTGISATQPFAKGLLEKLKIDPHIFKRGNYKNSANLFTEDKMDEYHRERVTMYFEAIVEGLIKDIAENRPSLGTEAEISQLLVEGPYNSSQAVDLKFIDELAYPEDLFEDFGADFGIPKKKLNFLFLSKYFPLVNTKTGFLGFFKGTKVAVITCEGSIVTGKNNPSWKDQIIGHTTTVRNIEAAAADKNVKAILIRVDSGGGSYIASDAIANSIIRAKKKGKKIVVSMGNVAASGGYFISQNADRIVASPLTITGSIGVLYGKFNFRALLEEHLGVTFDSVYQGESSKLFSQLEGLSEENKEKMEAMLDFIYKDFKTKVGLGRGITYEDMEELAQGKIWMGLAALENNLVDSLGGYRKAQDEVRSVLELDENAKLNLVNYPKTSVFDLFETANNSRQETSSINIRTFGSSIFTSPIDQLLKLFGLSKGIVEPFTQLQSQPGVQLRINNLHGY